MKHETFLKLLQGTEEDIQIACNWLVENHDPIEYISEHSNTKDLVSPILSRAIKFKEVDNDDVFRSGTAMLYYKYRADRFIIVTPLGINVTNSNYNSRALVVNH